MIFEPLSSSRHNEVLGGEIEHGGTVKSHIGRSNNVLTKSKPAECHVMAQEAMLQEEKHKTGCAGDTQEEQDLLAVKRKSGGFSSGGCDFCGGFVEANGGQHMAQRAYHEGDEHFLVDGIVFAIGHVRYPTQGSDFDEI